MGVCGIYFEEGQIDERYCQFFEEMYRTDYVLCSQNEITKNLTWILERFAKS